MENEEIISKELLSVSFNNVTDKYYVSVPQGSSVNETAFCMSVVIKCMSRDNVITQDEMLALIKQYLDDPQYNEVE